VVPQLQPLLPHRTHSILPDLLILKIDILFMRKLSVFEILATHSNL